MILNSQLQKKIFVRKKEKQKNVRIAHLYLTTLLYFSNQIKSNQITFIVTSPQHKCLGEWNSYERAPDSAKKQQQQFTYGQYIFTDCTEDNVQNTYTYTQYT